MEYDSISVLVERLHTTAKLPTAPRPGDAGIDLCADCPVCLLPGSIVVVSTGVAFELPPNHVGIIKDRSSVAKLGIHCLAGVVDSSYRGEVKVVMKNLSNDIYRCATGDRIAQMVVFKIPPVCVYEVPRLSPSERADGSFGSTGV